MTDETVNDDSSAPFERASPGRLLKRAREGLRLSAEDVARDLRLAPTRVEALEGDDYRQMPAPTFVRGYLRSYARLVRLPEDEVIAAYDEAQKPRVAPVSGAPKPAQSMPRQARSGDKPVRLVTYLLVAILLTLVFSWWRGRWEMPVAPRPATTEEQERIPMLAATGDQPARAAEPAAPEPGTVSAASGITSPTPPPAEPAAGAEGAKTIVPEKPKPVAVVTAGPTAPAAQSAVAENTVQVSLVFDGVSWADVRDARRQRLVYQQFKAGQSVTVAGVPPFKVYLSNAKAVRMRYAGEPHDVSAHQTGIYARFSIGTAVP